MGGNAASTGRVTLDDDCDRASGRTASKPRQRTRDSPWVTPTLLTANWSTALAESSSGWNCATSAGLGASYSFASDEGFKGSLT